MPTDLVPGHGLVGLAPGRVEVVRARLDLTAAGVDAAKGRLDAPGPTLRPRVLLGRAATGRHVRVGKPDSLELKPVVGDQIVERVHAREGFDNRLQLAPEPWMNALGDRVERGPRRDRAAV